MRKYSRQTQGVIWEYSGSSQGVLREYTWSTQEVLREYTRSTQEVLREYSGSTHEVLKEYSESTQGVLRQPIFHLREKAKVGIFYQLKIKIEIVLNIQCWVNSILWLHFQTDIMR